MEKSHEDVLAYAPVPEEHWRKIWSNDPLKRASKEVKTRFVGSACANSTPSGRSLSATSAQDL
jgi:transposase-like protein